MKLLSYTKELGLYKMTTSTNTTFEISSKPEIMYDAFREKIKCLPLNVQYMIMELFSKHYNGDFKNNQLVTRIVQLFNTMDLSGTDEEFKKRLIISGLKMLSEELCFIFINTSTEDGYPKMCYESMTDEEISKYEKCTEKISDSSKIPIYITNRDVLKNYFRIILYSITTLGIEDIKNILLDDFEKYDYLKYNTDQRTVSYLKANVFDDIKNYDLVLKHVDVEQRTDYFEMCLGTIVLSVNIVSEETYYYLVFDVLTKQVFMYEDKFSDSEIISDNFSVVLKNIFKKRTSSTKCCTVASEIKTEQRTFMGELFAQFTIFCTMFMMSLVIILFVIFAIYNIAVVIEVSRFFKERTTDVLRSKFNYLE